MAEGRMIKKVVSTSRKLANLKTDSARLLWTWLMPHTDVKGRFSAQPVIVKGYVVPRLDTMTARKIESYLLDLSKNDLIILYNVSGDKYLEMVKFAEFQTLREGREASSIIPPPDTPGATPGAPTEDSGLSKDKLREDKLRKYIHGDFVKLTTDEHAKLKEKFGEQGTADWIAELDGYLGSKGAKYDSHYRTILNWNRKREREGPAKGKTNAQKLAEYEKDTQEMLNR